VVTTNFDCFNISDLRFPKERIYVVHMTLIINSRNNRKSVNMLVFAIGT
jgi:hypothetical protein